MKMKALIVLPTGMADLPVPALEGRTPLQVAATPHLDAVARAGRLGTVRPVPEGLPITSGAALLSILGYDPRRERASRGGLEAVGLGLELGPEDVAFRLNFASTFRDHLVDFQAGPIRGQEARVLIDALNLELAWADVTFHPGLGYRNLMVVHGRPELEVTTVPPAVAQGLPIEQHLPTGADGGFLREIMQTAARVLGNHDVNRVRLDLGENAADQIWLWGEGRRVLIEPFELRTEMRLAVVAAVPLVRGLGLSIGATVPRVSGATGDHQTALGAKLACALELLETHDVVLLHVGAANEACHQTDIPAKVQALERLDRVLVGPAHQALMRRLDTRLLVTTDHMTSALVSGGCTTHVPFALWGPGVSSQREVRYTEEDAARGDLVVDTGHTLLELTLKRTT